MDSKVNFVFVIFTIFKVLFSSINCVPIDNNHNDGDTASVNPVILIPGLQGSQLEVLLQQDFPCHKAGPLYFRIWLNQDYLLPYKIECLLAIMELHPPNEQRVLARPFTFGDTKSIENLDTNRFFDSFDTLVNNGFTRNVSIRGAPYDFRLAPNDLKYDYYSRLDGLIYETYLINGERKPTLICHSLGCQLILAYLNEKSQTWKDKFINRLITVAAPFGGSMKALKAIADGDNMGIFVYDRKKFRNAERSFPSLAFLLPNPKVFGEHVIMKTPDHDYTANDYPEIFAFLNASQTYRNWNLTKDIIPDIPFPGVSMTCIYSVGEKTPSTLKYYDQDYRYSPKVETENGDGTVNLRSLQYCHHWINLDPRYDVNVQTFENINHYDLIRKKDSVNFITKILTE